jgi:hypothetical protein
MHGAVTMRLFAQTKYCYSVFTKTGSLSLTTSIFSPILHRCTSSHSSTCMCTFPSIRFNASFLQDVYFPDGSKRGPEPDYGIFGKDFMESSHTQNVTHFLTEDL